MLFWILELIRDIALKEKYNIKEINSKIKENRLLYELGIIREDEYKEKHGLLLGELETAKEIMENSSQNIRVREGI